jgi:hypothetical protein
MSDNGVVMRSKDVLSVIAFIAAFGISVLVTPRQVWPVFESSSERSFTEREVQQKITSLLSQDIENGRIRDRKINRCGSSSEFGYQTRFTKLVDATSEYADASASIDDSGLPRDFRRAWRKHMQAWQTHADYLEAMKNSSVSDRRGDFSRVYSLQNREISETWYEVLRLARERGAYIPAGAY